MNVFLRYCLTFSANDWVFSLNEQQKVFLNNKLPIIPTRHRTQSSVPCRQNSYLCQFRKLQLSEISFYFSGTRCIFNNNFERTRELLSYNREQGNIDFLTIGKTLLTVIGSCFKCVRGKKAFSTTKYWQSIRISLIFRSSRKRKRRFAEKYLYYD